MKVARLLVYASVLLIAGPWAGAWAEEAGATPLEGAWQAQAMESGGKPAPAEAARRLRFTFQGDKLLVKGNFPDDREEACSYKLDEQKSPNQLDFTPPKEDKPVLGIYELKGDQLVICFRHGGSPGGRPTRLTTKDDPTLILVRFKKAAP